MNWETIEHKSFSNKIHLKKVLKNSSISRETKHLWFFQKNYFRIPGQGVTRSMFVYPVHYAQSSYHSWYMYPYGEHDTWPFTNRMQHFAALIMYHDVYVYTRVLRLNLINWLWMKTSRSSDRTHRLRGVWSLERLMDFQIKKRSYTCF